MVETDRPRFPIAVYWNETGEVEIFDDEADLICNLEDFDSNDQSSHRTARVADAFGRLLSLRVDITEDLCEVILVGKT